MGRNDGITITPGPSTLVACPDGSYGSLFAHALGTVTTWAIADDQLTMTTADGGTGTFVEASGTAAVPSPTKSTTPSASASPSASPVTKSDADPEPDADGVANGESDADPESDANGRARADRDG